METLYKTCIALAYLGCTLAGGLAATVALHAYIRANSSCIGKNACVFVYDKMHLFDFFN